MISTYTLRAALLGLLFGKCGLVLAHHPMAQCVELPHDQIQCTGGFSDGSKAPGVVLDVISSDDNRVLSPGKLDASSVRVFTRPAQDFYILLEVGPGHTAEVDHTAIKPARAAAEAGTANRAAAK